MKNSTVLAAALAAGLTTFAANAQEEGARQVSMITAKPEISGIEKSTGKDEVSPTRGLTTEEAFHAAKAAKKAAAAVADKKQKDDVAAVADKKQKDDVAAVADKKQKDDAATVAEKKQKDDAATVAAKPRDRYTPIIEKYATENGIPIELAHAVITVESNYKPLSRGKAGEVGLMQIKPATAKLMGYDGSTTGLFDPETNIKYGMMYLGKARKLGDGTTCGTILKYNAGHAAKRMNPISQNYCEKVKGLLSAALELSAERKVDTGV